MINKFKATLISVAILLQTCLIFVSAQGMVIPGFQQKGKVVAEQSVQPGFLIPDSETGDTDDSKEFVAPEFLISNYRFCNPQFQFAYAFSDPRSILINSCSIHTRNCVFII